MILYIDCCKNENYKYIDGSNQVKIIKAKSEPTMLKIEKVLKAVPSITEILIFNDYGVEILDKYRIQNIRNSFMEEN